MPDSPSGESHPRGKHSKDTSMSLLGKGSLAKGKKTAIELREGWFCFPDAVCCSSEPKPHHATLPQPWACCSQYATPTPCGALAVTLLGTTSSQKLLPQTPTSPHNPPQSGPYLTGQPASPPPLPGLPWAPFPQGETSSSAICFLQSPTGPGDFKNSWQSLYVLGRGHHCRNKNGDYLLNSCVLTAKVPTGFPPCRMAQSAASSGWRTALLRGSGNFPLIPDCPPRETNLHLHRFLHPWGHVDVLNLVSQAPDAPAV